MGLRLTVDFLRTGNKVIASYFSNSQPLNKLAEKYPDLSFFYLDLSALNKVKFSGQKLDLLILNAGIIHNELLLKESSENFQEIIQKNLTANFTICRQLVPGLKKSENSHIIFISSLSALKGNIGQAAYSAGKAGLIGLAKSLAKELAEDNIKVNVILPGFMKSKQTITLPQTIVNTYKNANILRRFNTLKEISSFINWLSATRNISGQIFNLDSRL